MTGKSRLFFYLLALIASLILVGASLSCARLRSVGGGGGERPPTSPLAIELELAKAPRLNEPVTLTATLTATRDDAPNSEAWIELPTGAVYVDGALTWRGDVMAGAPAQFSATIAIVEDGRWEIKGNSYRTNIEDQSAWIDWDSLYLTMENGDSRFGWDVGLDKGRAVSIETLAEEDRPVGHGRWVLDGSSLVNDTDQPLFLVIYNAQLLQQAQAAGLISAERWGPWRQVLDTYWDEGLLIAVYDQERPTTGYRIWVDRITGYGPAKKVYVRLEPPSAQTPVTQRTVSAYTVIALPTQFVPKDTASEFIFVVNGQEAARQVHSVPTAWYNRVDMVPDEELAQRARSYVSESRGIPLERLDVTWGERDDYPFLWKRERNFIVRDTVTGERQAVLIDYSGNVRGRPTEAYMYGPINAQAQVAWKYGRLDRPLYDLLQTKGDGDLVEVAIWVKGEAPGRTLVAAQQPLVDSLKGQGRAPLASDKVPATFVSLPKRDVLQVAQRDDVAVIFPASQFSSLRPGEVKP